MRRRITFIQSPDADFSLDQISLDQISLDQISLDQISLDQISLSRSSLSIRDLDAVREDRVTFSFDELPSELWHVLKQCHQLHIRWAAEEPYEARAPFSSRVSPGLHVFYTPVAGSGSGSGENVCALLKKAFDDGLKCETPETSFITPPLLSTRFASTAALQFHSALPSLQNLVTYLQHKACASTDEDCVRRVAELLTADSIDVNYDTISHALTISGYWSRTPSKGWTEEVRARAAGKDQIEVGLLGTEKAIEPEEIQMGGVLAVVGKEDELSRLHFSFRHFVGGKSQANYICVSLEPTLFSFPSRHHPLPDDATYSISFPEPTGLHPTMTISLSRASLNTPPAPPDATCALHAYLTLPSTVFGDKYQLSTTDSLFLDSHHLAALRAVAGETDLEAPDWMVPRWGSNWLLELATPQEPELETDTWNVTIPLHLRYLKPSESGYRSASIPWPVVFWACSAEDGTKMGVNPFDRVNLGWEGLFGVRTMFYQLHPSTGSREDARLVEEIEVPVLRLTREGLFQTKNIELGTVAIIGLGLLWVLWKLGLAALSSEPNTRKQQNQKRSKAE
ncbi:PIG-X [Aspergillus floccosus]